MTRTPLAIPFALSLGLASGANPACAKERPYLPPPVLSETGVASLTADVRIGGASPCNPQGSISRNGSNVRVKLDFVRAQFNIFNPDPTDPRGGEDPVALRSYGGCPTGPELFVKPGDVLRVDLSNRTNVDDPTCGPTPRVGTAPGECFNTMNLHTHGLHVSPAGNSDNVLLNIAPQSAFPYEINIPWDHPAGTFWYHAHRHGSTAVDVSSGATGALVVKGSRPYSPPTAADPHPMADIDTVLHDADGAPFPDRVFLFQQIAYGCFANNPKGDPTTWWQSIYTTQGLYSASTKAGDPAATAPWTCPLAEDAKPVSDGAIENFGLQLFSGTIWDTNGRFSSVNGVVQPTITLPAGRIERWRFIHAGIHDTINVQIVRAQAVRNLIADSALSGTRQQQQSDVSAACPATPDTLVPQLEIADDGLTRAHVHAIFTQPVASGLQESNYLQPGYRSDILAVFPNEGDYCLLNQAAPEGDRISGQGPSQPELLAYIHVRGGSPVSGPLADFVSKTLYDANPQLPAPVRDGLRAGDLSPWAPFLSLPAPRDATLQPAHFEIGSKGFTVNGASYNPDVINITKQVDTVDDWVLTATGAPHVFHIHVNPFEILDVTKQNPQTGQEESIYQANGQCKPAPDEGGLGLESQYCSMWHTFRDTLFVKNGYRIYTRTRYDRYIGEYVLHCHILDHEDAGMMLNIAIVPDLSAPGGGLGMHMMHHDAVTHMGPQEMHATMPMQ